MNRTEERKVGGGSEEFLFNVEEEEVEEGQLLLGWEINSAQGRQTQA